MIYDQLLRFLISIAHPSDAATAKTAIAIPSDVCAAGSAAAGAAAVSAAGASTAGSVAASGASSIISSSTIIWYGPRGYYHAVLITVSPDSSAVFHIMRIAAFILFPGMCIAGVVKGDF